MEKQKKKMTLKNVQSIQQTSPELDFLDWEDDTES